MTHRHVDELYSAYLEGSLPDDLRWEVEMHLAECTRCAEGLAALRATIAAVRALPPVALPADFVAGVHARVHAPPRAPWLRPLLSGGLAAAALAALVLLVVWTPGHRLAPTAMKWTPLPLVANAPAPKASTPAPPTPTRTLLPPKPAAAPPRTGHIIDPFAGGPTPTKPAPKTEIAAVPMDKVADRAAVSTHPATRGYTAVPLTDGGEPVVEAAPPPAPVVSKMESATGGSGGARSMSKASAPATVTLADADAPKAAALSLSVAAPAALVTAESVTPAGKDQARVSLRVAAEGGTLQVEAPQSFTFKARTVALTPPTTATTLLLPTAGGGAAYTLHVETAGQTVDYLLILPGARVPRERADAAGLSQLVGLANEAGLTVLCPAAFATAPAVSEDNGPASLATLAVRRGYSALTVNGIMTIQPRR
jgi:hypothetical protein